MEQRSQMFHNKFGVELHNEYSSQSHIILQRPS